MMMMTIMINSFKNRKEGTGDPTPSSGLQRLLCAYSTHRHALRLIHIKILIFSKLKRRRGVVEWGQRVEKRGSLYFRGTQRFLMTGAEWRLKRKGWLIRA